METYQIECATNHGNIDYKATALLTLEELIVAAGFGMLNELQRSPSGAAEKEMAGYKVRPKGFKRVSLPFNDQNKAILVKHLSKLTLEVPTGEVDKEGNPKVAPHDITVTLSDIVAHDWTVSEAKFDEERESYVKASDRLAEVATKVGYEGDNLGDGTSEGAPIEFLRAIRKWKMAREV